MDRPSYVRDFFYYVLSSKHAKYQCNLLDTTEQQIYCWPVMMSTSTYVPASIIFM